MEEPVILGGKRLNPKEAQALWEEMTAVLGTMTTGAGPVVSEEPWKTLDAVALDQRTTASWIQALDASPRCKLAIHLQLTADNGVPTARQSYLGNLAQVKGGGLEQFWTETEVYRCRGGNQQLAMRLAAGLGSHRILLRTAVRAITAGQTPMTVTLASGRELEAEDVVLAVPPSTWNRIAIQPPLPPQLVPQMGSNVKFLMALKGRFWRDAGLSPNSFTDGPVSMTWEGTDNQPGENGAALVAFSGGPGAETCRQWTPNTRLNSYLSEIGDSYTDIQKYFLKYRFMDWPGDLWTRGGYSFPAPGQVTTLGPILREGLGALHFAGEHACYAFVGYMEGALHSGVTLARQMAARDGLVKEALLRA